MKTLLPTLLLGSALVSPSLMADGGPKAKKDHIPSRHTEAPHHKSGFNYLIGFGGGMANMNARMQTQSTSGVFISNRRMAVTGGYGEASLACLYSHASSYWGGLELTGNVDGLKGKETVVDPAHGIGGAAGNLQVQFRSLYGGIANIMVGINVHKVLPFIKVGYAFNQFKFNLNDQATGVQYMKKVSAGGINGGVGVRFHTSDKFAITLEGSYTYFDKKRFVVTQDVDALTIVRPNITRVGIKFSYVL